MTTPKTATNYIKTKPASKEMLGCPFCGCRKVSITTETMQIAGRSGPCTFVECDKCAVYQMGRGKDEASSLRDGIKRWNTRKPNA